MTASVPSRPWRVGLTFGILYCVIGALEAVATVLLLQSHPAARQPLFWVLLAASIAFFLIGIATIVVALVRRKAPPPKGDSGEKKSDTPFVGDGIPRWIRPSMVMAAILIGAGCVGALLAAGLHAGQTLVFVMIAFAVLGVLMLAFTGVIYRIYGGKPIE